MATLTDQSVLQALQDRIDVIDVLNRYSSSVDKGDSEGVRSTLADEIWAKYGNGDPVDSGDALAAWIAEATATAIWQHHLLNTYHVEIEGDQAKALSYLTSYQVFEDAPDSATLLVARYHDVLKRTPDGWKISRRVMEILWGETVADDGTLDALGGRGPKVW